jgi:hypothetical protein
MDRQEWGCNIKLYFLILQLLDKMIRIFVEAIIVLGVEERLVCGKELFYEQYEQKSCI